MIKGNNGEKLRLLMEWMDYFILQNRDEINESLKEDGIVFVQSKEEDDNHQADFGAFILPNLEVDVELTLTIKTGEDAGKSYRIDVKKRPKGSALIFNRDADNSPVARYQLESFMNRTPFKALSHLFEWMKEAEHNRKMSEQYEQEAEELIQESLINYCLDNRLFDELKALLATQPEA